MAADGTVESQDLTDRIMEYQRREHVLLARMARGEREMRGLRRQASEAAHSFKDTRKDSLKDAAVDPVVNVEIATLRQRIEVQSAEIERLRQELRNAAFHPNRIQGQKLLTKCAHLVEENAELGRQLGEERLQTLRIQLSAERKRKLQLDQRIAAFDGMAEQIDAENEKMQTRIADLGQTLKDCRADVDKCKADIEELKAGNRPAKKRLVSEQHP